MQNSDYIKERLNTLREYLRFSFLVLLGLLTGIITNIYQVLSHKVDFYMVIFGTIGFIILNVLLIIIKYLNERIEYYLKELKNG